MIVSHLMHAIIHIVTSEIRFHPVCAVYYLYNYSYEKYTIKKGKVREEKNIRCIINDMVKINKQKKCLNVL